MAQYEILEWHPSQLQDDAVTQDLEDLVELLIQTVAAGASVSFLHPLPHHDAHDFWAKGVLPKVRSKATRAFFARVEGRIVGSVLLHLDAPPNQAHRADVAKMLVHPDFRRLGIARALMQTLLAAAPEEKKTLITLDTHAGGYAETLYRSLGFIPVGIIPRFSKHTRLDTLEDAMFMYKEL